MQKDVVLEMNENKEKQKRLDGEPICYGDNVQLQHTLTRKYLATSTTETSRTEHTKLKVSTHLYSQHMVGGLDPEGGG